jgi:hypothetical protein
MILSSEREEVIKAAMFSLQITGTAYICGETITLTSQARTPAAPPPSAT